MVCVLANLNKLREQNLPFTPEIQPFRHKILHFARGRVLNLSLLCPAVWLT